MSFCYLGFGFLLPGSAEGKVGGGEPLFWGREELESGDWELLFICCKVEGESKRWKGRRGMEGNLRGNLCLFFSRAVAAAAVEEELFRRREGTESSICGCFERK